MEQIAIVKKHHSEFHVVINMINFSGSNTTIGHDFKTKSFLIFSLKHLIFLEIIPPNSFIMYLRHYIKVSFIKKQIKSMIMV